MQNGVLKFAFETQVYRVLLSRAKRSGERSEANELYLITTTCQYLSFGGGFNFRLGTYNVPEGPNANPYGEARSAEFDGTGWSGWTDGSVLKSDL